ncbi:MAG: hypothetical protein ACTHX2_00110 [Microbacterium sp.]
MRCTISRIPKRLPVARWVVVELTIAGVDGTVEVPSPVWSCD